MNYIIDKDKAVKRWAAVLENMKITDRDRIEWISEMAEYHHLHDTGYLRENAYANISNTAGMGAIVSPQPSLLPGTTLGTNWSGNGGTIGSGDLGQNLLPVSMKIAGQTIGLDLVSVKPSAGPKIDLVYIDFQYDDTNLGNSDERPQIFKLDFTNYTSSATYSAFNTMINAVLATYSIIQTVGGLAKVDGSVARVFTTIQGTSSIASSTLPSTLNTTIGVSATGNVGANKSVATTTDPLAAGSNLGAIVEFLGYSRIDGFPMFRAFKQANTAQTNSYPYINNTGAGATTVWGFDQTRNTFNSTTAMNAQITRVFGCDLSALFTISLISTLEDHIPGYVTNFTGGGKYPMDRATEENTYAGQIGPKISSKTVEIGSEKVRSALRRTEIEDIKANTGIDIVSKMEGILVNDMSQTISKQIVSKIFEMGGQNRQSAPLYTGPLTNIANQTIFDLDTAYVASGPGGETTHAVQRKLITKLILASTYICTEGRVGPAQFAVTNGSLAAAMIDIAAYTINPVKSKVNPNGQLYPFGQIGDIQIYVDPYLKGNDNRIVIGRKNNPDQPGIVFMPYLMAQSIQVISESTMAPVMELRSRYAITEVGWYSFKQYMTIIVNDANQYLN